MTNSGMKHDDGKPMMSLIPPGTMTRIANVMTDAVTRDDPAPYKVNSWRGVKPRSRYLDALMRHIDAILNGQGFDESGRPHIDHVLTNAAILAHFAAQGESILHSEIDNESNKGKSEENEAKESGGCAEQQLASSPSRYHSARDLSYNGDDRLSFQRVQLHDQRRIPKPGVR